MTKIKRKRLAEGSKDTTKDFKKGVTEGSKGVFKGVKDMAKGAIKGSKGVFKEAIFLPKAVESLGKAYKALKKNKKGSK